MNFTRPPEQTIDSESNFSKESPLSLEYYIFNENIVINPGTNTKRRQTLGFRLTKSFKRINIETEYAYQTGKFYLDEIKASLASINIEIPLNFSPYIKSLSFSKEYISGDEYLLGGSDGELVILINYNISCDYNPFLITITRFASMCNVTRKD